MPTEENAIIILEEVDSTNHYALENFDKLPHMTAIFANKQNAGRGRQGRKWHSPSGNIYASFILKKLPWSPPCAGFATSLIGVNVLSKFAPNHKFQIKLPNDIICENRKIGGVLCEIRKNKNETGIVAGIGLNINSSLEELEKSGTNAASLMSLSGKQTKIDDVRQELVSRAKYFFNLDENKIISEFIANCMMIGIQIAVKDASSELKGILKTIMSDGAAVIETNDGKKRKIYSGDFAVLS